MSVAINGTGSITGIDQGFNITSGNLGIGTDNPLSKLHLSNTGAEGLEIYIANSSNVNVLQHYNRSASSYVTHRSNALDHRFETSGSEKLRITSGGSVGFNTTFTQSSKTVHIAGDYRSVTQNVADEGLIFQSFTTASTGDVYPGISWTGNPTALGRARASINAIATNDNNGSDIVFLTRNAADGTELEVADDEKVRITSGGKVGIRTDNPKQIFSVVGRANFDLQGDYYGSWINGDSQGSSSFNVGAWHNAGGRMRNEGSHLVLETMNTSHWIQLQPSGGNISVGSNNPNGLLALTASSGRLLTLRNSSTGSTSGDGSYLALTGSDLQIANAESANLILYTADTERLRITSAGVLQAADGVNLQMASNGRIFVGNGGNATDPMFANVSDTNTGIAFPAADTMMFTTGGTERFRIDSSGNATFKHKVNIGDSHSGSEILSLGKSSGTSYMAFHNGGANMGFIGYASELISGGGTNELGIRSQDDISFATGGNSETLRLTTSGYAYFGGYPTTHTVASGSPIKVRSGAGAWGISLGMRYSQNDYGYIGFTDMNGTENLGDINVNRTGPNTGRMALSTNNGSGSLQRLRIESTGEVVISDDGTFRDQRMPLVITGQGFGHGHTQGGTTQDTIYMTAGASGNYSTLTLTVDKVSWGSIAYEIHCAAYSGRHLHRVGGFYQNGTGISGDHGTTTASSGSSFSISGTGTSQQFRITVSGGGHWTHPSAWVRLSMSGNGYLRSDLISMAWS